MLRSPKLKVENLETPAYLMTIDTKHILEMEQKGFIKIPPYQRKKEVWDTKPKMKPEFIVSILERHIITPGMMQETPSGVLHVLNWQQRLDTIKSFRNNKFAIPDKVDAERAGMKYKNLSAQERKTFDDYNFAFMVQVSSNGKGKVAYSEANKGLHLGRSETLRGDYYDANFFKYIQQQLRNTFFKGFFNHSGVLTKGQILRCEDESFMGELLLLVAYGACEKDELITKLDDFKKKQKEFSRFKSDQHELKLRKYIKIADKIFPKGFTRETRFGNKTSFYRLLGAIRLVVAIHGNHDIFSKAKCKRINSKLVKFAVEAGAKGRKGTASGDQQKFYASTTRATTNKTIREIGIEMVKKQIIAA